MDLPIYPPVRRVPGEVRRSCGSIERPAAPSHAACDADETCVERTGRAASGARLGRGIGLSVIVRRSDYYPAERGAGADSVVDCPYDKPVTRGRDGPTAGIEVKSIDQELRVRLVTS